MRWLDRQDRLALITVEADQLLQEAVILSQRYQLPPQSLEQAMMQASGSTPPYTQVFAWLRHAYGLTVEEEREIWRRLVILAQTDEEYARRTKSETPQQPEAAA